MGLYRSIKEMPNWKLATGIILAKVALLTFLASPHVHVGRESKGMDIRRYTAWMFSTPEPITAEVRKGEYDGRPLLGQYSFEPGINETVTSSRVYRGENGEIISASTDDWGRDGEQDTLRIIATTGEWSRDKRKVLYARGWTKERLGGKLVLFSDSYQGPLTPQEAVALSPDLEKFSDKKGNIDAERFAVNVRQEAYRMTEAQEDGRFKLPEEEGK